MGKPSLAETLKAGLRYALVQAGIAFGAGVVAAGVGAIFGVTLVQTRHLPWTLVWFLAALLGTCVSVSYWIMAVWTRFVIWRQRSRQARIERERSEAARQD